MLIQQVIRYKYSLLSVAEVCALSPSFWLVNLIFAIGISKDPKKDKLEDFVN